MWRVTLRTGLLGVIAASLLLLGVACTGNGGEDGTVADSNVGSVTSDATEKNTDKSTEKVTEARTEMRTEQHSGTVTTPGTTVPGTTVPGTTVPGTTVPGTTPGTDMGEPTDTVGQETSAVTTPGTMMPGTTRGRSGHMGGK